MLCMIVSDPCSMQARGIDKSSITLIKMDAEGAEYRILPQIREFLESIAILRKDRAKPALWISFHDSVDREEKQDLVLELLASYKFGYTTGRELSTLQIASRIPQHDTLLVSDVELSVHDLPPV